MLMVAAVAALSGSAPLWLPAAVPCCRAAAQTTDVELAPEIEIHDWINGDGRTTLADFRGEVVLLEFWNTH